MKRIVFVATVVLALSSGALQAQVAVYDGLSDLVNFTTTASVPHTFTGQAFNASAAGGATPQIGTIAAGEFVIGAQTIPFSRVQIQLWGTFDPAATGANPVFSNPIGAPIVSDTGAINTTGNAVFVRTVNLPTPVTLPSTTNLGITLNWQSSVDGVTFIDNTNLVTAFRVSAAGTFPSLPIPVGQNITTGTNIYYRNASNEVDFNFLASSARSLAGQTQATDGLAFSLTTAAVPEPASLTLVGLAVAGYGVRRFKKKK